LSVSRGYEDLNDQDDLRHDPVLAGKLAAKRSHCAPLAGKPRLNPPTRVQSTEFLHRLRDAETLNSLAAGDGKHDGI